MFDYKHWFDCQWFLGSFTENGKETANVMSEAEKQVNDLEYPGMGLGYEVNYSFGRQGPLGVVKETTLAELLQRYADILWDEGKHKYNVKAFIGELDEILLGKRFSTFSQEMLDGIVGALRKRGNSNATINRKMAALGKLLRKAYKMGDIHNLPEFKRQKEKAGRLRFLEADEEEVLFREIASRSELYLYLSIFLVDTGARLGEAIDLKWNDIHEGRATFWVTKSGRSRTVPPDLESEGRAEEGRGQVSGAVFENRSAEVSRNLECSKGRCGARRRRGHCSPYSAAYLRLPPGEGRHRSQARSDVAWPSDARDDDALRSSGLARSGHVRACSGTSP